MKQELKSQPNKENTKEEKKKELDAWARFLYSVYQRKKKDGTLIVRK